jgi:hypothetical protein
MVIFTFSGPFLFYTWILSVHRLSNLREILSAMHTMIMLPIVNEYPRCRAVNSTHFKCLPNTFLIGASKCGTTSLIEYLDKQPRIKLINRHITIRDHHREIHRFDRNTYVSSWKWLELAEEWASAPIVNDPNTVVIHYTPHYLYAPTVPMDMLHFYPQDDKHPIKFIILLRNPVKRALSSYWFSRSHLFGKDKLDSGDINEFTQLAQYEIQQRQIYDNCMHTQLFGNGDLEMT